eukprot:365894-Chlamydomonas_euryale.AAC.2
MVNGAGGMGRQARRGGHKRVGDMGDMGGAAHMPCFHNAPVASVARALHAAHACTLWRACTYGCMAAWLLGCLAAWLLGCMAAWLRGCMAAWLHGCMAAWRRGDVRMWYTACRAQSVPSVYPHVKPRRVVRAQDVAQGRRSRPITPAEADAGPRMRTCMRVNAPGPEAERHLRACMPEAEGPAEAETGVIGRDRRPRQASFVSR